MIVLSVGMEKSGTGWYFNLTNDLLIAAGHQDVHQVREKYNLHSVLQYENCNVGLPTLRTLGRLAIPHLLGNTFVVKTHREPTPSLRCFIASGMVRATYIYRDPRDVALSAFEHGQRIRRHGKNHSFARLETMRESILFAGQLLGTWDKWMQSGLALVVRYENLVADPLSELERLVDFLALRVSRVCLQQILENYQKDKLTRGEKKSVLHFNQGIVGRFKEIMSAEDLNLCEQCFGGRLEKMGYR
jgi:hypothetical protein